MGLLLVPGYVKSNSQTKDTRDLGRALQCATTVVCNDRGTESSFQTLSAFNVTESGRMKGTTCMIKLLVMLARVILCVQALQKPSQLCAGVLV